VLFFVGIVIAFVALHVILNAAFQTPQSASEERLREVGRLRNRLHKKSFMHEHY
jgi:hypothetical protein